ncbi:hypothetical protein LUD75_18740 [Epilithonimonas sp. JDS]|uniref:JAB domain-containing protein n=1 Tax=Epilithonimonas sp. JDS TaxID=2902797 RepID=UPI001E409EA8|nr:JAB domain-containing protein [Epilithonimonas sp. JDS]MCD9856768.1 hypothetical protein [Epilithonimonas sp. JDS]
MKYNIVNEIKLSYSRKGNCERSITSSMNAVDVFRAHFDAEEMDYRESFFALYLNQADKVLGIKKISECGISSTLVDVRIIMQTALSLNANRKYCHYYGYHDCFHYLKFYNDLLLIYVQEYL